MNALPGWYPDPQTPGIERYWDGSQWTPSTRMATAPAAGAAGVPPAPSPSGSNRKRRWPWVVGAVVLGFVAIGVVAPDAEKDEPVQAAAATTTRTQATTTSPRPTTRTTAPTTSVRPTTTAPTTTTTVPPASDTPVTITVTESASDVVAPFVGSPDTAVDAPYVPAPYVAPPEVYTPAPVPYVDTSVPTSFANCSEARAAGAAPLYAGSPGYSSKLDRDGDGVACE